MFVGPVGVPDDLPGAGGTTQAFEDRRQAGRLLAARLAKYKGSSPLVLALPRGGVPVGYEIAQALGAPLDVFITRKLGAPNQPELGIGAIAPGGMRVLDTRTIEALGITEAQIEELAAVEGREMERRLHRFRGDRPMPEVRDRTVILVDDGIATGVTAYSAVQALALMGPRKIVVAAPVCARQAEQALRSELVDVVCVAVPPEFGAVGLWYRSFEQTSDEEVVQLLRDAQESKSEGKSTKEAQGG